MALNPGWGRRLRSAKKRWEERHDRDLTFGEIGARVAQLVGREMPYSHVAAGAWFEKGQEPASFDVAIALAQLLEEDPGELIVGRRSASPSESDAALATRTGVSFRTPRPIGELLEQTEKPATTEVTGTQAKKGRGR